jgi:hypothetical protein
MLDLVRPLALFIASVFMLVVAAEYLHDRPCTLRPGSWACLVWTAGHPRE